MSGVPRKVRAPVRWSLLDLGVFKFNADDAA